MKHIDRRRSTPPNLIKFNILLEDLQSFRKCYPFLRVNFKQLFLFISRGIPAVNEKGERLLLFFGIIDLLQT